MRQSAHSDIWVERKLLEGGGEGERERGRDLLSTECFMVDGGLCMERLGEQGVLLGGWWTVRGEA